MAGVFGGIGNLKSITSKNEGLMDKLDPSWISIEIEDVRLSILKRAFGRR